MNRDEAGPRKCLRCRGIFNSVNCGNRLCKPCKEYNGRVLSNITGVYNLLRIRRSVVRVVREE